MSAIKTLCLFLKPQGHHFSVVVISLYLVCFLYEFNVFMFSYFLKLKIKNQTFLCVFFVSLFFKPKKQSSKNS